MRFRLVAVGRIRHAGLRGECERYETRIARYVTFTVREVRDAGRRASDATAARRLEGAQVMAAVGERELLVALTRTGDALDSEAFARQVRRWREEARDVTFVIGGAEGLGDTVLARAERQLTLSSLTLPHELARLVLLEQMYRACTIIAGEPYHRSTAALGRRSGRGHGR